MTDYILNHLLYFFFYSCIGWVGETIYCSVGNRKFVNRGFLTGPLCPIYGTAGVLLSVVLMPIHNKFGLEWYGILLTAVCAMVVADIIEYLTSYIMEKLFNTRWWDYTDYPFNLHGRICLRHTMYWGIAGTLFIYVLHPWTINFFNSFLTSHTRNIILAVIIAIFIADLIHAVIAASDIRGFMDKLSSVNNMLNDTFEGLKTDVLEKSGSIKEQFEEKGLDFAVWFADTSRQLSELADKYTVKAKGLKNRTAKRQYKNMVDLRLKTDDKISSLSDELSKLSDKFNEENDKK